MQCGAVTPRGNCSWPEPQLDHSLGVFRAHLHRVMQREHLLISCLNCWDAFALLLLALWYVGEISAVRRLLALAFFPSVAMM